MPDGRNAAGNVAVHPLPRYAARTAALKRAPPEALDRIRRTVHRHAIVPDVASDDRTNIRAARACDASAPS